MNVQGTEWLIFIKHKTDVLDRFKIYNAKIKTKFERSIKYLHVDNGTEYCNDDFKAYINKEAIELETIAPYTHQQNCRVERDNPTIVESPRSILYAIVMGRGYKYSHLHIEQNTYKTNTSINPV